MTGAWEATCSVGLLLGRVMALGVGRTVRFLLRAPVSLYRWRCGWLLGRRFLLLIHTGRRTGQRYETVLEVMEIRETPREFVVMSGFGPNANWLRNIQAACGEEVIVGGERFPATHRFLTPAEGAEVIARYEARYRLIAPLIRVVLSKLLGWRYDGSPASRLRAAEQLPLIAFSTSDTCSC